MEGNKLTKDKSSSTGFFYIDSARALFYDENLQNPLQLDFPGDIISDLEVISRAKLGSFIQNFVETQKISPKNIFIILSNSITFDKDFPEVSGDLDKSITDFLELVPFEDYVSKRVALKGKVKIVVANKELCEITRNTFSRLGFVVVGVYPLSLIVDVLPELSTKFDFSLIINKIGELRDFNLLPSVEAAVNLPKQVTKNNKRILILVGIFVVFLIMLLIVFYFNMRPVDSPRPLPIVK